MEGFGGGGSQGKGHLFNHTIRPFSDYGASELDVGENEWPQIGMVAEKIFLHFALWNSARLDNHVNRPEFQLARKTSRSA